MEPLQEGQSITFSHNSVDYQIQVIDGKPTVWMWDSETQDDLGEIILRSKLKD